jgi:peptidoglycan/LPS O-acetylase OafA/YrhL
MSGEKTSPHQGKREIAAHEHGELPPLSDPGKDERAAEGVPVVPAFDGYRAFAILSIVFFHILINSGIAGRAGGGFGGQLLWATGPQFVDILFVVSGFVVFLPTVAQRGNFGSVRGYAIRRGARLMPAYWLSLGVMLLVMATKSGLPLPGYDELASNFSGQQTFVQLLAPDVKIGFALDTPIWTLTNEIGFYLVLPLIARAYFRRPFIGLAIGALIAVLWREAFHHVDTIAHWFGGDLGLQRTLELQLNSVNQLPNWAFSFAAGMTAAWIYVWARQRYDRAELQRLAVRVLIPAAMFFALFIYLNGRKAIGTAFPNDIPPSLLARESSFLSLGYTASLASVMLALALSPPRLQLPFATGRARKLGDISYGIYLIQAPLLWLVIFHFALPADGNLSSLLIWTAAIVPAAIVYGYLSARFLEQPIRRWARRFGRREQAVQEPAGLRAKAQT